MRIEKEKLIEFYTMMVRIREFEEEASQRFLDGEMPLGIHQSVGQEAVAAGVCMALRRDDYITSTHRGHHHCIAKGCRLDLMMAELYGKETGYCRGKGGTMHIASPEIGVLGANGIVGAGLPLATGAGLAIQVLGQDRVAVCFFGDGASSQGTFHESLNLASIWELPVIFVCENNMYAEATPIAYSKKPSDIASRAAGYDIPGIVVDGMDVLAVYETTLEAAGRARRGEGPTLLECQTYRYYGHYIGEPLGYRSDEEVAWWKSRDPIEGLKRELIEIDALSEEDFEEIKSEISREVKESVSFARDSPFPEAKALFEDVFFEEEEI